MELPPFPKRQVSNGGVGAVTASESQDQIVEALVAMNAAIRNIRLYPPASGLITNSVRRAYEAVDHILTRHGPIELSESEKVLLIGGLAMAERNRKKPQAAAFLHLMLELDIRSLSLAGGLSEGEFRRFLILLSRPTEEVASSGGFQNAFRKERFAHIHSDQKLYMAVQQGQQLAVAINDPDIACYLAGEAGLAEIDRQKAIALARNPQWLARSIQAGADLIKRRQGFASETELLRALRRMVEALETLVHQLDKPEATRQVVHALHGIDREVLDSFAQDAFSGPLGQAVAKGLDRRSGTPPDGAIGKNPPAGGTIPFPLSKNTDSYPDGPGQPNRFRKGNIGMKHPSAAHRPAPTGGGQDSAAGKIPNASRPAETERRGHRPLAEVVCGLYRGQQLQTAKRVLGHLARGLSNGNPTVRGMAARNLGDIGDRLIAEGLMEGMGQLSRLLTGWVAEEKALSDPYRRIGQQLKEMARIMLHGAQYADAEPIIDAYARVMAGDRHEASQRQFAEEILRGISGDGTLDRLLEAAQADGTPAPGRPGRSLALLLGVALDQLLDRLRDSREMSERVRLIKVLSEVGTFSPQILVERIKSGEPWYFLRNLVLLLGKLGREAHAPALVPLLNHEDVRVRSEALNALYLIGGQMRESVLIKALKTSDERFRLSIVSMLGAIESKAAVPHLLQMLESRALIASRSRSELEEKICTALGRIGSESAVPILQTIAEKKGLVTLRAYTAEVRQAARAALDAIALYNPVTPASLQQAASADQPAAVDAGPPDDLPVTLAREEERVTRIIAEKGLDAAVQLLLERILAYAHAGELDAAGRLRERLSEINPLALTELFKADDAIAQGRKGGFNRGEIETWRDLYDSLNAEEANALYVGLRPLTLAADETIVRQGDFSPNLYFVHGGELKITCRIGEDERLISIFGPGEVAGKENFFNASVATVSVGAVTRADLGLLSRDVYDNWSAAYPGLRQRLRDYCESFPPLPAVLEKKGFNRRGSVRLPAEGEVLCRLENDAGQPMGRAFRGNLVDVSVGGTCFHVRVASAKTAHMLLGRRLQCEFRQLEPRPAHFPSSAPGRVVAIRPLQGDLFSIHLKFTVSDPLPAVSIEEMAPAEVS